MDSTDAYIQRSNSQKVSRAARGRGGRGKRVVLRAVAAPLAALLLLFSLQPMPNAESPKPQEEQPVYGLTEETPERETPESKSNADYWYELYSDHVELVYYLGSEENLTIPKHIEGRPVTVVKTNCFKNHRLLESVTIPDSVTNIGRRAFEGCGISKLTIPDSVTAIGMNAFSCCSALGSVVIPDSVTRIEPYTFSYCESLSKVTIPESVVSVGHYAFDGTPWFEGLTDEFAVVGDGILLKYNGKGGAVVIPEGVKSICADFDGAELTDVTIPDTVMLIGGGAFTDCKLSEVSIPNSVLCIEDWAFGGCPLKSVTIPDSVTTIGESAFAYCRELESVTIPDSVTRIDDFAFNDCEKLKSVTIPDSVTDIGVYAFYDVPCYRPAEGFTVIGDGKLIAYSGDDKNVVIPDGVKYISVDVFRDAGHPIESVVIPDSVVSIGGWAFSGCGKLKSVTIPDSVTSIGSAAFSGCGSLERIDIPDSVEVIGSEAFYHCSSLERIDIPDSVKVIGSEAFAGCTSLRSVNISGAVTEIADDTFAYCSSLTSISIPNSVTSIGESAFSDCCALTDISIPDSVTDVAVSAFDGTPWLERQDDEFVIVGDQTLIRYNGAGGDVVIPDGLRHISGAFSGCETLTSVRIPDTVTSIGDESFSRCGCLETLNIPDAVSKIGTEVFAGTPWYESLTDEFVIVGDGVLLKYNGTNQQVRIPSGVKYISDAFMADNTSTRVTEVTLPDSVTVIGDNAFAGQYFLESIVLPNSLTRIGERAFSECAIRQLILPDSLTSIGTRAFHASAPSFVSIPDSVTVIEDEVFSTNSGGVISIVIPASVIHIGSGAFYSSYNYLFISCPPGSYAEHYGTPDRIA